MYPKMCTFIILPEYPRQRIIAPVKNRILQQNTIPRESAIHRIKFKNRISQTKITRDDYFPVFPQPRMSLRGAKTRKTYTATAWGRNFPRRKSADALSGHVHSSGEPRFPLRFQLCVVCIKISSERACSGSGRIFFVAVLWVVRVNLFAVLN